MDILIDILIIIFYPFIILFDSFGKGVGKGIEESCCILLEMWDQFITFISKIIFRNK